MLKRVGVVLPTIGAAGALLALSVPAHADTEDSLLGSATATGNSLLGSTTAIFLGGTGQPTPSTAYVDTAEKLFLQPLGFADATSICDMVGTAPCDAPLQVLTTPEVFEFGPSSLQGETDLVNAVEAAYKAGEMSYSDPLTIFAYSQSAISASAAEQVLADKGIPQDDLHFVFIGDPNDAGGVATNIYSDLVAAFGGGEKGTTLTNDILSAIKEDQFAPGGSLAGLTPNDLYPTTIYTIDGDGVADWQQDFEAGLAVDGSYKDAFHDALHHFITTHVEYLGLTPAEVASGVASPDGLTTTITIPDGTDPGTLINDHLALIEAFAHGVANSGAFTALVDTIQDLFNPTYF